MSYATHAFRPIVGNAVFCSDCPNGDSFGATHPWHVGHDPVPLDVAVGALHRAPAEALWRELDSRPCLIMRLYTATDTWVCTTHRAPADHRKGS